MENSPQIQLPEEEGIDIKKYIFLILSHWWWFGITIFVGLTVAYLINRYSQDVYSVECSVIVGEPGSESGSIESVLDELSRVRNRKRKATVENEITILKSYKLARLALEELNFDVTYVAVGRRGIAESYLYKRAPFHVFYDTLDTNLYNQPLEVVILSEEEYRLIFDNELTPSQVLKFGEKFNNEYYSFTLRLNDDIIRQMSNYRNRTYYFQFNDINSLTKQYRQALQVNVNDEKGSIINLSMHGFVPAQIADYLNKLSEIYLRANLNEKNLTSENTIRFIDDQLGGIVDSLEQTGMQLQQFRTDNKVVDLSREGTFLYQQLLELQSEKALYDIRSNYFEYLQSYVDKRDLIEDVVAPSIIGIQDNLLNKLVTDLNELVQQRRQLSFSVSSNSPQLALVDNQIASIKNSLKENLRSLTEANRLEQANLEGRIANIDRELKKLPATEKQMIDIQRKFTINDQIYTFLLQKRAEAGITKASNTSDHKILDISRPENASQVKPKISMNYSVGLMVGFGLPLVLLLLVDFFNTKLTDRKFLEANLNVPIVGNIGHNEGSTELPVVEKPGSSLAESFRALRTNLQFLLQDKQKGVIAVTSAVSGEGKTFCSANLASILAMSGKKTLLVSLDLRRPKIHRVFNFTNSEGMSTHLIGKTEIDKLYQPSNVTNLWICTSGPVPPNPAELLGSDAMKNFLAQARKKFDYIILDTPPVAIVTDTLMLKGQLDALIFVVRHSYSDKQVVELANSLADKRISDSIGVTVNDIQLRGYYGYSYRYGYGYGYGYSYSYRAAYYEEEPEEKSWIQIIRKNLKIR